MLEEAAGHTASLFGSTHAHPAEQEEPFRPGTRALVREWGRGQGQEPLGPPAALRDGGKTAAGGTGKTLERLSWGVTCSDLDLRETLGFVGNSSVNPGNDHRNRAIRGPAMWSWGHGQGPIQEGLGSPDGPWGVDPCAIRRGGAVAIVTGRFRAVLL